MKNFLLLLLFTLSFTALNSQAVSWELSAEPGDQANSAGANIDPNFTNNGLSRGAGVSATTGAGSMNSSGWFSGATPTTLADAIAGNDYYEFTINNINCQFFNPTTINIVMRSSATGPNTATLRCSSDGFTTNIGTVAITTTSAVKVFSETISPNSSTITYRLYGYGAAAGGGTPSTGGTMRIGTSVVAGDNDIELFASSTVLSVAQVSNITVTDGDAVPLTALVANVPGATVSWSRTPETIGLVPTNGTGNIPAFNAFNASGVPVTSTFTVSATLGACTSVNMTFTITVNPAPCTITVDFFGNPGPCNDNGTPNDPSDDFFTQNIHASFFNRPSTGSLQIVPGGDQIGTYSIPVNQIIGNSHLFTAVQLRADGTPTIVQMNFTDDPGCIDADTGPAVEPCSFLHPVLTCPPAATVSCTNNVAAPDPSSVQETHACPGNVAITHLGDVTSNNICANRFTITRTYQGADDCAQTATCAQIITVNDQTPPLITFCPPHLTVSCANNVPPADPNGVIASDNCGGAVTKTTQFDGITGQTCPNRFQVNRIYAATDVCGNTGTCSQIISVNDQTKPTMTCPGPVTVSCASNVPAANINLVTGVGDNCGGAVNVFNFPSDAISNQTCVNRFTITRSYFAVDVCGNSNNCLQTIVVNDQTPPTLTCPAPVLVSCVEQVPVPNPALLTGLSDNCAGAVTPSFFSQTTSNQTCVNRFTLTRQYRATDVCGNTASCTQVITVNDVTPPAFTFVPPNLTVECYLVPGGTTPTAADNCNSGATVSFLGETIVNGVCPIAFIHTRTWRATDACGNSTTTSQQIFVTDTHAPQFLVLPKDRIAECGTGNAAEFQAFLNEVGGATVEDCAEITYSYEDSPIQNSYFDCGNTFHKNIRFIATDRCGNSSFRDASFTVVDLTPPVFSTLPQNVDFECDDPNGDPETAFYDWVDSYAGLVAEDACGEVTLEKVLVSEAQTCVNTWRKTYEFRAYDQCGNLNKQKATFSVVDHTPPSLICPPNTNTYYACREDVPTPDLAALTAWDCSGVTLSLNDIKTEGTGCANWPMTVFYRFSAIDGCGNTAVCEQAFYVRETDTPTLACPDTIKLVCVDDIPGPLQLFDYVKTLLASDCAGGFTSIKILSDSGQPQNGASHRTYSITAKNHCGLLTSACNITFKATGICRELCTASLQSWGSPNGTIGGMNTADVIDQLIQTYGPITVGGGANTLTASDATCVQELLFGAGGTDTQIPTGHHTCPLPSNMMNANGALENPLAANAIALQLNIWYNLAFNDRDLGVQDLNNLPPCLAELGLMKELAQHATIQDVLNLANDYMQGYHAFYDPNLPAMLQAAIDNLNFFRVDCGLNAPCERPAVRSAGSDIGTQHTLRLFPNPATDRVNLEFWAAAAGEICLKIVGARGMISEKIFQVSKGLNAMPLSLNQIPAGVYWVTLRNGDQIETLRLVKMGH